MDRFHYVGNNRADSCCGVDIYTHSDKEEIIVVVTDIGEGLSVTNSWPDLADKIVAQYELEGRKIIWVEHYLKPSETFDLVLMVCGTENHRMVQESHPWVFMTIGEFTTLLHGANHVS